MDTQRLILLVIFSFSVVMLWQSWERTQRPASQVSAPAVRSPNEGVPVPSRGAESAAPATIARAPGVPGAGEAVAAGEVVRVRTDLVVADINTVGATLQRLELLKQKAQADDNKDFVLLGPSYAYSAQSGLIGEGFPNHRSVWKPLPGPRELAPGNDKLEVRFTAQGPNGLEVQKVYTFRRDHYQIDVAFELRNTGGSPISTDAYYQLVRDDKDPPGQTAMMKTFFGPAYYTEKTKYHKLTFADIEKGNVELPAHATDGWIGMVQHYFVSAWLPAQGVAREFYAKRLPDGLFASGVIVPAPKLAPGASGRVDVRLYSGPQEQRRLKAAAPGFDLVVDYGWLTIIAWPLFWLLQKYHGLTGNWGFAIILLTLTVKLVFFPLSAASYKSMAKMKLVAPRLTKLREMYGDDRAKMNQAMMELYKTEKINPLGGCFPILVQIPVFLALYWTLLGAIELRHAPFILWIKDLSAQDPYYVLPILMTVSMVIQTRMNPTPPDPVQAKVMTFMPFVFSVFFFFFPAGLVLYWLVNNILSILQQWQIQRMFNRDKPAHGKR
jgi:YidC/Oxa1 family membrane protein insertase